MAHAGVDASRWSLDMALERASKINCDQTYVPMWGEKMVWKNGKFELIILIFEFMKRIYNFILLLCLVQLAVAQNRIAEIRENLLGNYSDRVLVVSHRADWRNAPENSLQGIQNCIDMGVDMVEIDLKKTKDGHLVVMHDKTINRTMTGKGNAEDYTLAELKAMRLKNGAGCKTRHQIPTLEEVMLLCKGKIMVNIDKGYDYFQEEHAVLEKTGTIDHCVIKAGLPL